MKLVPSVIGIENPRTGKADSLPNRGGRQVAPIARHELDDQASALIGGVDGVGQRAAGVQGNVQIAVHLMAEPHDRPGYDPARGQHVQPVRVVNACEDIGRSPTPGRGLPNWNSLGALASGRCDRPEQRERNGAADYPGRHVVPAPEEANTDSQATKASSAGIRVAREPQRGNISVTLAS